MQRETAITMIKELVARARVARAAAAVASTEAAATAATAALVEEQLEKYPDSFSLRHVAETPMLCEVCRTSADVFCTTSESDTQSRCPSVESVYLAPTPISQNQRADNVVCLSRKYRDMVALINDGTVTVPAKITQLLFLYACHLSENMDEDVATSADPQTDEQRSPDILDRLILEKQAHHLGFLQEVLRRGSVSKNDQLPSAQGTVHEISKSLLEQLHDREVAIVRRLGPLQHSLVSDYLPSTSHQAFGTWMGSDSVVDGAEHL
jgi:hypothetical protein